MAFCSEVEDICNLDCIQTPYMKRIILKGCNFGYNMTGKNFVCRVQKFLTLKIR